MNCDQDQFSIIKARVLIELSEINNVDPNMISIEIGALIKKGDVHSHCPNRHTHTGTETHRQKDKHPHTQTDLRTPLNRQGRT